MEGYEVSSLWPDYIRAFWSHRGVDVLVSDMEALHTLSETLGATAVCSLLVQPWDIALTLLEHHTSIIHGPHLFLRLLHLLRILPPCYLFRSHTRLLRSIRYSKFLRFTMLLHCARFTQSERLL